MDDQATLAEQFDRSRGHLRGIAFRMLGSADEADDAVQEAWIRAERVGTGDVGNVTGWLTTIVGRICLDMLRARERRREELTDMAGVESRAGGPGPEDEAVLADSVGLAMLVVLDALGPAERVAFVLHDMFSVPFGEIAEIIDKSPVATKKLASRARHRVHGTTTIPESDLVRQGAAVEAFLTASRAGDLTALLAVLAPDVVRRADPAAVPPGGQAVARGARAVAEETVIFRRGARFAAPALVNGAVGIIVAPRGRLRFALTVTVEGDRIAAYEVIADPARLERLDLAVLAA